jgi:hypothetical protein
MQCRTHHTPRGDRLVVLQYMMLTKPLLDLSAVVHHTGSFDTRCSVTDRILIQWCRASHLHQVGPLLQKRSADEFPESLNRMCSCPTVGGVAVDPLHGMPHSAQAPS